MYVKIGGPEISLRELVHLFHSYFIKLHIDDLKETFYARVDVFP